MPWMRLNPAVVVEQLRAQHGPGDEDAAEQALAHLREALLSGVYIRSYVATATSAVFATGLSRPTLLAIDVSGEG